VPSHGPHRHDQTFAVDLVDADHRTGALVAADFGN
jgi:hypothetical protein